MSKFPDSLSFQGFNRPDRYEIDLRESSAGGQRTKDWLVCDPTWSYMLYNDHGLNFLSRKEFDLMCLDKLGPSRRH